jgi:hypothetical protein
MVVIDMPDPIMIQSFEKGINQSRDKQIISFGEAYDARNCDIKKGTLKRCTGSSAVNTNVYTGNNIDILMKYFVNNSGTIMVGSGSSLYKYANNSFTKITDVSSMDMDYLNYQIKDKEILIFANGSDDIRKYDGTTVSVLKNRGEVHGENGNSLGWMDADGTVKSSESLCTGKVPKGKYVELHKERLWISGIVAEPNSIYFSAPYDPEDFIAPGDDIEANQNALLSFAHIVFSIISPSMALNT